MPAAQLGDDAERAGVVAAFADLQVRRVALGGQHPRRDVVVDPGRSLFRRHRGGLALDRAQDVLHLAGAQRRVDLGDLLAQLLVVALGQAARDDQAPRAPRLLLARHLQDGVDRLLLGAIDERAGVHDDHVRVLRVRDQGMAARLQAPEHHLAVDQVLRTAQAHQPDAQRLSGWQELGGLGRRTTPEAHGRPPFAGLPLLSQPLRPSASSAVNAVSAPCPACRSRCPTRAASRGRWRRRARRRCRRPGR